MTYCAHVHIIYTVQLYMGACSYKLYVDVYVQGCWRLLENIQLYILCTCVCTWVLECTGEHNTVVYYVQVYVQGYWRTYSYICTGVLEGTGEHTVIYILYMCMYRGAGGYWKHTAIYIMYMCIYRGAGGYWRVENIQLYIFCTCVCTGVLEGTGEHTVLQI